MRHRPRNPADRPARWTVRIRTIAHVLVGLAVAASLLSVYLTYQAAQDSATQAAAVDRRLAVLEDDLNERTRQRDAERDAAAARAAQDREQFRARFCEVLTELSATFPNLDQLREALGCSQPTAPASAPHGPLPPGIPAVGPRTPSPTGPSPTRSAPAAPPGPASPTPAPPSEPPATPGLICGLLPIIC